MAADTATIRELLERVFWSYDASSFEGFDWEEWFEETKVALGLTDEEAK